MELRELDRDNFDLVIGLQVAGEQQDFLNSNVETIAWAHVAEESSPLVIYAGDAPVGLAAYGYVPSTGLCWIRPLAVDDSPQQLFVATFAPLNGAGWGVIGALSAKGFR